MAIDRYPTQRTDDPKGWLNFGELRELVAEAMRRDVPDDAVIRGEAIPFRMADLGNPKGGVLRSIAIDDRPAR
ncbi:hypothetical protein [Pseudonocardia sp. WMMC193]|uniref:hypothetical protein n=1 Tax=Pseudonocardia sp. WMMC193 TaxID=2911965 RepID=UPI001F3177B6|nr:hypothetical protein [Pseudonocardia sp. WMMC193]MCF7551001.1 hypothetical protein [Pseudonocardia sp. WMMC193]